MDLDKAENARSLLNEKERLIRERNEILNCTIIRGDISDGFNGRPFSIKRDSVYIDYVIRGLNEDISSIDLEISKL